MLSRGHEREALTEQFQKREAGVAELLDFYARLEGIYVTASKALEQNPVVTTSNSTSLE